MRTKRVTYGALIFLFGWLVGTSYQGKPAQAAQPEGQPEWILQTRTYPSSKDTWDAYIYNVRTGETFFLNQSTKTLVKEGVAKGADKKND